MDEMTCSVELHGFCMSYFRTQFSAEFPCFFFWPNQVVFGKNPVLLDKFNAGPPAFEKRTYSELVADSLNAKKAARSDLIHYESDEKVCCSKHSCAFLRQARGDNPQNFNVVNSVFNKRNESDQWRGTTRVIGRDD